MGNCCSRCCDKAKRSDRDFRPDYGSAISHQPRPMGNNNLAPIIYSPEKYPVYPHPGGVLMGGVNGNNAKPLYHHEYARNRAPNMANPGHIEPVQTMKISNSPPVFVSEPSDSVYSSYYDRSSQSNLQHIAEREPEDLDADPSLNPTKRTMFIQHTDPEPGSRSHYNQNETDQRLQQSSSSRTRLRSNSTSTIYLDDSTVSRPDPRSTVWALSYAVYLHIKSRDHVNAVELPSIFDETLHPIQKESIAPEVVDRDPDHRTVHRFIRALFQTAQLSPECAIVTMVYLERILTCAEAVLTPRTWRRVVLYAIILASKVWDDQAVWNVDYCQILKDLDVEDVNKMELKFLAMIQFNTDVTSAVYAKYYFDIRRLNPRHQPYRLSVGRANRLEAYASPGNLPPGADEESDVGSTRHNRRFQSLESLVMPTHFRPAILP